MVTTQTEIWSEVNLILSRLETFPGGQLKQNATNRKIMREAVGRMDTALKKSGYYKSVGKVAEGLSEAAAINEGYFAVMADINIVTKGFIKDMQLASIKEIQTYLANEGLEIALKQPLTDILNKNIGSGGSFTDLLAQVRQFIVGGELGGKKLEGTLLRYSQQITYDTLANFSASLQQGITQDLGLEFYKVVGGTVENSRDFCIERNGKYFHKREIQDWATLVWAGKRRGTTASSIFIYRGGYRCGHSYVPVHVSVVPKAVIKRAINKGYYVEPKKK